MATNEFINKLSNYIDKNTMIKEIPRKLHKLKNWITTGIIRAIRHRDNLLLRLKKEEENALLKEECKVYRNKLKKS